MIFRSFVFGFVLLAVFSFSVFSVRAEDTAMQSVPADIPASSQHTTVVADVNVGDVSVQSREDGVEGSFSVLGGRGQQNGIVYGIITTDEEGNPLDVMPIGKIDTLHEGEVRVMPLSYVFPVSLEGKVVVWIYAETERGVPLGRQKVTERDFGERDGSKASCSVDGNESGFSCISQEGDETLDIIYHKESFFGVEAGSEKVNLEAGKAVVVQPKLSAGGYVAIIHTTQGKVSVLRFRVPGPASKIANVLLYKGQKEGSVSGVVAINRPTRDLRVHLVLKHDQGECADVTNDSMGAVAEFSFQASCRSGVAEVTLLSSSGDVLDSIEQSFSLEKMTNQNLFLPQDASKDVASPFFTKQRVGYAIVGLIVIMAVFFRGRALFRRSSVMKVGVFLIVVGGGLIGVAHQTHAMTLSTTQMYMGEVAVTSTATVSSDKASYVPGDTMTLSTTYTFEKDTPMGAASKTVATVGYFSGPIYDADIVGTQTLPAWGYVEVPFSGMSFFGTVVGPYNASFAIPGGMSSGGHFISLRLVINVRNSSGADLAWSMDIGRLNFMIAAPPAPTVTLSPFNPATITAGSTSSISFSSTNATSCTGSGIWNGNVGTSNAGISTPAMSAGTYTQSVTCTGPGGSATSLTRTLQVNPAVVAPTATISASGPVASVEESWWRKTFSVITGGDSVVHAGSGTVITVGENAALTWSSTSATSCSVSGNGISRSDLSYSNYRLTGLPTGVFTYTISCSNVAGTATDTTTITVNPPRVDGVCAPTHYNCVAGTTRLDGDTATTYNWTCMGSGGGSNSPSCTEAKAVSVPGTPSLLSANPGACGSGTINIGWNSVSGATSYQLRDGGTQIYDGATPSFNHTGLTDGSSHSYTVRATNGSGSSAWSGVVNANAPNACAAGIPGTPTSLNASPAACGSGTINIGWNSVSGATSYQLRDGGTQIYDGATSSFSHTGLMAGSAHSYTVRATNGSGSSSWSGAVNTSAPNACVTTINGVCGVTAETCVSGTYSNSPADTALNYQWTCLGAGSPVGTNSGTCTAPIPTTYTITATAGSGGFISPSGSISGIPAGSSRTFTITENYPYVIDTVIVNTGSGPVNIGAPGSYTFNNITSNGTISVTFRMGTTSGITQAQGCTILAGNSTCTGRVSWTTAGDAVPPIELSVSGTGYTSNNPAASNQPVALDYGSHTVTLRDQGGLFEQATMTAVCFGALIWNQGICQASGGMLSAWPTSCTIPVGQSTCDVNFTWWTQNLASASVYNWTRNITYSTALSGTAVAFPITFGNNSVRLRDDTLATRDMVTVRGTCAGVWNATLGICEAGVPTANFTNGACTIPNGASTCNIYVAWTSSNLTMTPSIQQDGIEFSTATSATPGTVIRPIKHVSAGGNTFTFVHDGITLSTKSVGATCAIPLFWNGTICSNVCVPTDNCVNHTADTDNVCVGSQYVITNDGCGNTINCPGTRSCDYNWKEVAP